MKTTEGSEQEFKMSKAMHKDIVSMMQRDIKNIKEGKISSRSDDSAYSEIVDIFNKHLPEDAKFNEYEKKKIVKQMPFSIGIFRDDEENNYDKQLQHFKDTNITGVSKSLGEKSKTLGAMAFRFMGVAVATMAILAGGLVQGAGYVVGAVPVVGSIARHAPGSSAGKSRGAYRTNFIVNLGRAISSMSGVAVMSVLEKQLSAARLGDKAVQAAKEIKAPNDTPSTSLLRRGEKTGHYI